MSLKILSTRYLPMKNNKVIKISAEIKVVKRSFSMFWLLDEKISTSKSKGITAISWKSKIPNAFLPYCSFISPLSFKILSTTAVEESASAKPTMVALLSPSPKIPIASSIKTKPQVSICKEPFKKTSCFIAIKCLKENSSPMVNIKNTIPNSAIWVISPLPLKW